MRDKKLVDVCFGSSYFDKGKQQYVVEIFLTFKENRSGKIIKERKIRSSAIEMDARERALTFFEECKNLLKADNKSLMTFSEYVTEYWLPLESKRDISPKTLAREKNYFDMAVPYIGEITMMDFEIADMCDLFLDLGNLGYSRSCLMQARQTLFRLFEYYRKVHDKGIDNPVDKDLIYIPNRGQRPPRFLSQEEEVRLLETIKSIEFEEDYKNYIKYAFVVQDQTGLRPSEILGLRWSRVDFKKRTLLVDSIGTEGPDPVTGKTTTFFIERVKSKNSHREIPLSDRAVEALTELYEHTGSNRFVVSAEPGKVFSYNAYNKLFKELIVAAGITINKGENFGPHSLRHTFATRLYELGADIHVISALLGHADIATTMKYYVHTSTECKSTVISLLNELAEDSDDEDSNEE